MRWCSWFWSFMCHWKRASFCVDVFYFKHPRHSQLFVVRFLEVSWTPHCSRNNIPDHLFKTLGWWSSDCYTRYIHNDEDSIIRTGEDSIRNAQIKIMRTASSEFGTYSLCEQRRFRRACASAQSRQNIRAVSPEPSLLDHTSSDSRGTFRQKASSLVPLNGWACAVKICHDGMLEDKFAWRGSCNYDYLHVWRTAIMLWIMLISCMISLTTLYSNVWLNTFLWN